MIADITNPLLGLDFLNKLGLIVDCSNKTIYDPTTTQRKSLEISASSVNLVVNETELPSFVRNVINEKYPDLITPHKNSNKKYCGVYHRIDTGSHTPVFEKPRRLNVEKLETARSEFKTLQKDGVISLPKSEWSSPLHIASKSSVLFRCCGDYHSLNSITDRYPIPNINSFSAKLANKRRFSKIDLISAYHQIKMHPDDEAKSALTTPFGLYEYNHMPFGLKNASATFQRYMDKIFEDIDCVFIYINGILIFSNDEISHKKDIKTVFSILNEHNLKISATKSVFNVTSRSKTDSSLVDSSSELTSFLAFSFCVPATKTPIPNSYSFSSSPHTKRNGSLFLPDNFEFSVSTFFYF